MLQQLVGEQVTARRRHPRPGRPTTIRRRRTSILAVYPSLNAEEKRDALNTLAARAAYGQALHGGGRGRRRCRPPTCPPTSVRQLRNLKDTDLDARIAEVWGIVRTTPADRAKLIAEWKKKLDAPAPPADLSLGRAMFAKTCQQCHTLFGVGGKVGPDITGSNRAEPRLPAGKHPRPQRRHPQGVHGHRHRR